MSDSLTEGQLVNTSQQMGLASIPKFINHYVGAGPTFIEDPNNNTQTDNSSKYVILTVESGSFRLQLGDTTGTISSGVPGSTQTDGEGSFPLEEFEVYVFTAPDGFTIAGNDGSAILTVGWLS